MAALDNLTPQQNRGVLRQIADNELMAEAAPALVNRPRSRLGLDPTRVSMLPHYTPRTADKWKDYGPGHPQEGILGTYYHPNQPKLHPSHRNYAWQKDLMQDYNLPNFDDRMVVWQDPRALGTLPQPDPEREGLVTRESEQALIDDRANRLATLVHEADHRGYRIIENDLNKQLDAVYAKLEALEVKHREQGTDKYEDPAYTSLLSLPDTLFKLYARNRGPETEELAVRTDDARFGLTQPVRNEAMEWLDQYSLAPSIFRESAKNLDDAALYGTTVERSSYPMQEKAVFQERPFEVLIGEQPMVKPRLSLADYVDLTDTEVMNLHANRLLNQQGRR